MRLHLWVYFVCDSCENSNDIIRVHIKWASMRNVCMYNEKQKNKKTNEWMNLKSRKAEGLQNSIRLYNTFKYACSTCFSNTKPYFILSYVWCAVSYFVSNMFYFYFFFFLVIRNAIQLRLFGQYERLLSFIPIHIDSNCQSARSGLLFVPFLRTKSNTVHIFVYDRIRGNFLIPIFSCSIDWSFDFDLNEMMLHSTNDIKNIKWQNVLAICSFFNV